MARDPQAALMALNRFGLGARGGASGDLINAASDPRGFVKADLNRQGSPRLEMPGLQPTPALAQAVFAYQAEAKAAREAAKGKSPAEMAGSEKPTTMEGDKASESKPLDNRSMDSRVMEKSAVNAATQANEAAPLGDLGLDLPHCLVGDDKEVARAAGRIEDSYLRQAFAKVEQRARVVARFLKLRPQVVEE